MRPTCWSVSFASNHFMRGQYKSSRLRNLLSAPSLRVCGQTYSRVVAKNWADNGSKCSGKKHQTIPRHFPQSLCDTISPSLRTFYVCGNAMAMAHDRSV